MVLEVTFDRKLQQASAGIWAKEPATAVLRKIIPTSHQRMRLQDAHTKSVPTEKTPGSGG